MHALTPLTPLTPTPGAAAPLPTANHMHVDHAIALSDFEATPRRDVVSIWLWLSDVEEER